jgi:hypothetical protein
MGRFAVRHTADNRHFVGDLSGLREQLAKSDTGQRGFNAPQRASVFKRRIRLGVERLLVRHPTRQKNKYNSLSGSFFGFVMLLVSVCRSKPQKVGKC